MANLILPILVFTLWPVSGHQQWACPTAVTRSSAVSVNFFPISNCDLLNQLEDQSIIFQQRTKHVPLNNHLKCIGVKHQLPAYFVIVRRDKTVEYHLLLCMISWIEKALSSFTLIFINFYTTPPKQMRLTFLFFKFLQILFIRAKVSSSITTTNYNFWDTGIFFHP